MGAGLRRSGSQGFGGMGNGWLPSQVALEFFIMVCENRVSH